MPDTPSSSIFPFSTDLSLFAVARLSPETHRLADRARQGQVGRYMRPADFQLDAAAQFTSPDLQYAAAVRLIAERAPLNITPRRTPGRIGHPLRSPPPYYAAPGCGQHQPHNPRL